MTQTLQHPPRQQIPWTPLVKPLGACRVALVSSAGIARHDQPPSTRSCPPTAWWARWPPPATRSWATSSSPRQLLAATAPAIAARIAEEAVEVAVLVPV